jgi:hypothetical protein
MREDQRENVARPVGDDGAITVERESQTALEPGACRGRVATRWIGHIRTGCLDDGYARCQHGSRGNVVSEHNECCAQTVTKRPLRVVGKHALNLDRGIPTMRKQEGKRVIAPP